VERQDGGNALDFDHFPGSGGGHHDASSRRRFDGDIRPPPTKGVKTSCW
jgi:hypothetical protein